MTTTLTPRLGLPQSDAGTDDWPGREGFNDIFGDLDNLTALDLQVANLAARPAAGIRGRYCWVEDTGTLWRDNGTSWFQVFAQGALLNDLAAPDGDVDMGGFKLTGLAAGAAAGDAVTKAQLDAVQAAIAATKLNAFAAPDGNVNLNSKKITNLLTGTAAADAANVGQIPEVRSGLATMPNIAAGNTGDKVVNFGYTFSEAPDVVVSLRGVTTIGQLFTFWVHAVTTTSVTIRMKNDWSSTTDPSFHWIAVVP